MIVTDMTRFSQMQKTLQRTNQELESLKARLNRLEEAAASSKVKKLHNEVNGGGAATSANLPLPTTELKELSEMARRFK